MYETKDSGERMVKDYGFQRDVEKGKARFDLLLPADVPYEHQFLTRVASLLARGAEKYNDRNWEGAREEDLARFKSSAFRHFMQWINGEKDEDHAAAVVFNLLAHETIWYKEHEAADMEALKGALKVEPTDWDNVKLDVVYNGMLTTPTTEKPVQWAYVDPDCTPGCRWCKDGMDINHWQSNNNPNGDQSA